MEDQRSKQSEDKPTKALWRLQQSEAERTETERIETEQSGIKIILEFPKIPDKYQKNAGSEAIDVYETALTDEEGIRQEIRTLLADMLREYFRKNVMSGFAENTSERENVL